MGRNGKHKKRILLGVVTTSLEEDFMNSYSKLLVDSSDYKITPRIVWNHPVVIGSNLLAQEAIDGGFDYLMLVGRYYSGFHIGMLHSMVEVDADVATIRYRYQGFPFTHMPMNFEHDDEHKLLAVGERSGIKPVSFAGLDFCLIKTSILRKIGSPYFSGDNANNLIQRMHHDFSRKVRGVKGTIIACLDHYLPHEIMSDNVHANVREVYHYMNNKKMNPDAMKKKGKALRDDYDKLLAEPIVDIPVHVLTPCARPKNIRLLNESIYKSSGPHNLSINWHIMYKNHDNKFNIIPGYNRYLDQITTGWFTLMCDDNMFHPELFKSFSDTLDKNPNMGVYVVCIMGHTGSIAVAAPENCLPFKCDAAQYFFNREVLGDLRFDTGDLAHGADGKLLQDLYKQCPDKFVFDNRIIAYHEALKNDAFPELECYETPKPKEAKDPIPTK